MRSRISAPHAEACRHFDDVDVGTLTQWRENNDRPGLPKTNFLQCKQERGAKEEEERGTEHLVRYIKAMDEEDERVQSSRRHELNRHIKNDLQKYWEEV